VTFAQNDKRFAAFSNCYACLFYLVLYLFTKSVYYSSQAKVMKYTIYMRLQDCRRSLNEAELRESAIAANSRKLKDEIKTNLVYLFFRLIFPLD